MTSLIFIAADLAAISILTFVLYLRRHRRRRGGRRNGDPAVERPGVGAGVLPLGEWSAGLLPADGGVVS